MLKIECQKKVLLVLLLLIDIPNVTTKITLLINDLYMWGFVNCLSLPFLISGLLLGFGYAEVADVDFRSEGRSLRF